jgi:nucleoside-diphosphate-sugar epimerase/predicted dehydrogenase
LLGAGYILDAHARALTAIPGVALHAVCDQSRTRAESAAARFRIPHILSSVQELAESACDVVHVLLPPALHVDAATTLVDAGKSVFLEKPMGLDSSACVELTERAARKRVALGVNHNFLFSPRYESLRATVKAGDLGAIDQLEVSWHFALPTLQTGPFDSWMFAAPANLLFEVGPHVCALLLDLLGKLDIAAAVVGRPIVLPGGQRVFRHWSGIGKAGAATALLSISLVAGQPDRILRLRARGGSTQLDFGRDISWLEATTAENPIFDAHDTANITGRTLRRQARRDRIRRLGAALRKRPGAAPFEESILRSIAAFYAGGMQQIDPRHSASFASDVIRLCESIASAANIGAPSRGGVTVPMPSTVAKPTALVVGGTGFIGRRLVRALLDEGHGVRVLTRNARAAAFEFSGLPVELHGGSHGDLNSATQALDGIKTVYHLAKCEGKRWEDYVTGDIEPTRVLAEAALSAGVKRFIYTGTIASYASANARGVINNQTPIDPAIARRDHYARSKAACETLLQTMHREKHLPLVIMRPGIVIGQGSTPWHPGIGRFLSETRIDFWGDGRASLPLVLVDDVAAALALALRATGIEGATLLLTSPPLLTAREYVEALATCTQSRIDARVRPAWRNWAADLAKELAKNAARHPNRRWPSLHEWRCRSNRARYDSRATQQVLGWRPVADRETMIARGIADAVTWFLR